MQLPIQFLRTSDDVRIACCSQGEGRPLVFVRGWLSHIELAWDDKRFRAYFEPLIRHFRLVRYDMRGNGLSDRHPEALDLEAALRDLETVMDGLALDTATLYGQFFGGPIAIAYAARHPERVSSLILDNTYARGRDLGTPKQRERFLRMLRENPETAMFRVAYLTDPEPQGAVTLRDHYQRLSDWRERVSPETVARLYALGYAIDVTDLLDGVAAPTLVMHRRDNRGIGVRVGRDLASRIKGATFVALQGAAANPWDGDAASALSAVGEFLGLPLKLETVAAREDAALAARLRTILFTDMQSSTETTQRLGDAGAQDLVRRHNTIVRDALKSRSGHEIKHTGDGIMASFASASGAVECAIDIQRAIETYDKASGDNIRVRIGINAGEPIEEDGDLFGSTVILASRIAAKAGAGEILIPETVRGLLSGKNFLFSDRGEFVPKGFDDAVRLFEVRWREDA